MDCNEALVKHGYTARIDARSLVDQGLDRLPMVHEGPTVRHMEQQGRRTERGEWNCLVAAHNHIIIDLAIHIHREARARLHQEAVQERRDSNRQQAGWSASELAVAHQVEQACGGRVATVADYDRTLTQLLQGLGPDPLVRQLALLKDPERVFRKQWRNAEGLTLWELEHRTVLAYSHTPEA
ncbi:MAG: hypothetical protein C7B43_17565 [Sulfobacillus benefaciens]|uniref:MobA/MobL protein domain-containing protein n=1 Tax=Sulfobacillus benefaciens TaxID=453960 RepID=A0A2T2WS87_9FIRM|nr:MAG: hypothetical protein C7B43_17565 [Sulfobacillus benefaciens]